ncbi:MAG TPA: hypothetical protein VHF51_10705 [Solirubrobacteraceae bacterium]|nr:hypothetical protein [Solirubrobacteraceae bacterium]
MGGVATVRARRRSVSARRHVHVDRGADGVAVSVAVLKQTRVDVVLHGPTRLALSQRAEEATEVRCTRTNPAAFVALCGCARYADMTVAFQSRGR